MLAWPAWSPRSRLRLVTTVLAAILALGGEATQWTDLVYGVFIELSIGKTVPLSWRADVSDYSLALPLDAPLMAIRVAIAKGETPEEEGPFADGGGLSLRVPLRNLKLPMRPGMASDWLNISTDYATLIQLEIAGTKCTIRVIRARIASNGQGAQPDPGRRYPPAGTLAGLVLRDSMGKLANMAWFTPRTSFFHASISEAAHDVRLVATPNDPNAELEWRRNGGRWDNLVSGLTSSPAAVNAGGWTLFEVRVRSAIAEATGVLTEPLIYQIAVTKEQVCHPKCRSCNGPGAEDCLTCYAPLVLHSGECMYTSCQMSGKYFEAKRKECLPCHHSCQECQDGSLQACTLCPALRYLLVSSAVEIAGQCVVVCPFGYFVQPTSQRCKRAPPSVRVERFYVRLALRVTVDEFEENQQLIQQVLQVAAETLAVSPQDVRFHKWVPAANGLGVHYFLEVENPFLKHRDVEERVRIDEWFSALPVPVDSVAALSQKQLYPPAVQPLPEPFLKIWMYMAMALIFGMVCVVYPLYRCFFIRKYFQMHPYKPRTDNQEEFIQEAVLNAPPAMVRHLIQGGYERKTM